jgi:hypothetical protein
MNVKITMSVQQILVWIEDVLIFPFLDALLVFLLHSAKIITHAQIIFVYKENVYTTQLLIALSALL